MSLRCPSSPHRNRCAGLRRGPHTRTTRTLVGREVFFATYTPRQKQIAFFRTCGCELCEAFFDKVQSGPSFDGPGFFAFHPPQPVPNFVIFCYFFPWASLQRPEINV